MTYRQMKRQPRAKAMLPAIKELISIRAIGDNEKDRNLLAEELREEIKKKFPQELPPTVATLTKKISEARNHALNPLDKHWHLGILDKIQDYGISYISSDDIEAIFKVQQWLYRTGQDSIDDFLEEKFDKKGLRLLTVPFSALSIRQAKWIAALHRIIGNDIEYLWLASLYYSYLEIISNISDTPFDTWQTDLLVLQMQKKQFIKHLLEHMRADQNYYGDDFNKAWNTLDKARNSRKGFTKEEIEKIRSVINIPGISIGEINERLNNQKR